MREPVPSSLRTARLALRRPRPADAAAYLAVFGDARANASNPRGYCPDLPAAVAALHEYACAWEDRGVDVWAACLGDETAPVIGFGGLSLRRFGASERLGLGYGFLRGVWGRGYAKELAAASVAAARRHAGPRELWARAREDNVASWKVLESAGMAMAPAQPQAGERWYVLDLDG